MSSTTRVVLPAVLASMLLAGGCARSVKAETASLGRSECSGTTSATVRNGSSWSVDVWTRASNGGWQIVGTVDSGATATFNLPPGSHRVTLRRSEQGSDPSMLRVEGQVGLDGYVTYGCSTSRGASSS